MQGFRPRTAQRSSSVFYDLVLLHNMGILEAVGAVLTRDQYDGFAFWYLDVIDFPTLRTD